MLRIIKVKDKEIICIEVPDNASEIALIHENTRVAYFNPMYKRFDLPNKNCKIVGLLKDLTDTDVDKYAEFSEIKILEWKTGHNGFKDYRKSNEENSYYTLGLPKESFISLLQSKGIDTNKNLLILENMDHDNK